MLNKLLGKEKDNMSKFPFKKNDQSHIILPREQLPWSSFQKALFKEISVGKGHIIVEAYAGASKTTSIIESFRYVPKHCNIIALAFNKRIQEELQARAPSYALAKTFHSISLMAIKKKFGNVEIDEHKVFNLVKDQFDKGTEYDLLSNVCDAIAFCKYTLSDTPDQVSDLIDRFDIDLCEMPREEFISTVIKVLGYDKSLTTKIDFNDMIWFPYVHNLHLGTYQMVFLDERQDMNRAQFVIAKKLCDPNGGRIIAVGDEFQNLYSWLGSDNTIIDELKKHPNTKTLPLPISYRCPKKVIELVQKWVPDIICPDTAIEGEINDISLNELYKQVKPGCFVLSRTNAPLIKICFSLIRLGIKANIRGRDVGKQLNYLIKKSKKKGVSAFLKWLDNWKDAEVEKLVAKNIKIDSVMDRYECLVNLCDEFGTLEEVSQKIKELFNDTDEKSVIILSTVHRAKGLERDEVFVLRWTFRVWFDQMEWFDKPNEEGNIAYVACSRSRKKLFIVHKAIV
jgi:ATP-dependent DNA helicase UvrD/PcrA